MEKKDVKERLSNQVELIREVFKYAHRFVSRRFVIQISSELFDHQLFSSLLRDLALLQHNGIQLSLVPGAASRINTVLHQFNQESKFNEGLRISAQESMPIIVMAAFDMANKLMTELSSQRLDSVIGSWVRAQSLGVVSGNDFQMTGSVTKINAEQIKRILGDGLIPILPCVGWNSVGQAYNLSSLELARVLAVELQAEKLFYITDSFSLNADEMDLGDDDVTLVGNQITSLNAQQANNFLKRNRERLNNDSCDLIEQAIQATGNGVDRVHILDGSADGVILREIFSTQGSGVMIHVNPFSEIRPMKLEDISSVLRIVTPEVEKGNLLTLSREDLLANYEDFIVYEVDGSVRGCAALHCYSKQLAEICSLAVDPAFSNLGIGRRLLLFLIENARKTQVKKIFVLTTKTADWFLGEGFLHADISELPEEKSYNNNRNSRIYRLDLQV